MPPFRLHRLIAAIGAALPLALAGCATLSAPAADAGKSDAATIAATANAAAQAAREVREPNAAPTTAPSAPGAARPPSAATTAVAAAATAAAQAAQSQKPFLEVVKDAKETEGLLRLYQKDDRVWIEVTPEQLDQPMFFKSNINQGIGEGRIFGGSMNYPMGVAQVVVFHKVGQNVQLIAKNTKYTAKEGTPEARAVAAGFSDSLLASAPVVAQPHPTRKSYLIDANALLLADIPMAATQLERTYRQPYGFDARNSSLGKVTGADDNVTIEVSAHYALSRLILPPPAPSTNTMPAPPITLPDVRSMFIGYHYSFSKLPATPMHARLADERIGYFTTDRLDFTSDVPRVPVTRYVNRWRLEKKDPAAAMSEPKQPIVFWLDRNIPVKYRAAIGEGILEWNKAFERIGFKDAIKVEVQPDDADFDTSDIRHASVRWQTVAKTAYGAIGPSVVDPRTGEILDADIGFDANNVRVVRNLKREYVTGTPAKSAMLAEQLTAPSQARSIAYCTYDDMATQQAAFGLSLLEARGDLDADSPDLDRFVNAFLKDVTMHEVGHTLGLRHNFRASTIYTEAQLTDAEFTKQNGIAGSVMEYNPWNISLKGEKQGEYQMSTLGPYDYWAIEYGYRQVDPAHEAAELDRVASRSSEPLLAYSTDEDVAFFAVDPAVNQGDLSSDPLGYAKKRLALVRELWQRTEKLELKPGESYSVLRRNFTRGLNEAGQGAVYAARYIGGLTTLRDHVGSGRQPFQPVDVTKQRQALDLIATEIFSADSFSFSPAFLRKMTVSIFDMDDAEELGRPIPPLDFAVDQQLLTMQRNVLDALMSPTVAQRLLNNAAKTDDPRHALKVSDLYATLHGAIWSELKTGRDITLFRRNLQREHVLRVANALLRPSGSMPADARATLRADARALRADLAAAQHRPGYSAEAKAHVAEALTMIDEALKAPLVRQAA
jgi:hypothetical protein